MKDCPRPDRLETEAFKAVSDAQAAVAHGRRAFEDQRQAVERKLEQQVDKVTALTLAVREDRHRAAEARMETQEAVREVKGSGARA